MQQGNKNAEHVGLGIDLGGTKIAGALFNSEGMVSQKEVLYLENKVGDQVGEQISQLIRTFTDWSSKNNMLIVTIGVAVPGIYNSKNGHVWAPNIPGWDDFPLMEKLNGQFRDVEIKIDSDRACYILGETWKGAAIGSKHAIFLAVGTGIGAGILIDGKVLRGKDDIAGSIGWMAITDSYIPEYSKYGCFEYHASGPGISRMAKEIYDQYPGSFEDTDKLKVEEMTTNDIFKAFEKGNSLANKVISQSIQFWGKASANLVSLFNPEIVIFGGGVFGPAVQFLDEIYLEAKKWAQPVSIKKVQFKASELGSDAGLYGAGYLSLGSTIK